MRLLGIRKTPLLRQKLEQFDFNNPPTDPIQLAVDLTEAMLSNNGIGLAANQCGLPYRAFVIKSSPIICCFNPIIVDFSPEQVYMEEACLSFLGLIVKVKRPSGIKLRYTEPNGNIVTAKFDGLTARIMQHELAHLEGRTMLDDASAVHKDQVFRKLKKRNRT